MIHLSLEMTNLIFALVAIVFMSTIWLVSKREVNKVRAAYFAKHGRYPGEPRHEPAE
ncbi:MAG: hypothetical protein V4574_18495 [Pseudomonadota bacterium]